VVGKMGGRLDHAADILLTTCTKGKPPALYRKTRPGSRGRSFRSGRGEAVSEDAAFEVTTKFSLDVGRHRPPRFVLRQFEPGGQMRLHRAVEHGTFGLAATIGGSA
jgi:hypothetical protein